MHQSARAHGSAFVRLFPSPAIETLALALHSTRSVCVCVASSSSSHASLLLEVSRSEYAINPQVHVEITGVGDFDCTRTDLFVSTSTPTTESYPPARPQLSLTPAPPPPPPPLMMTDGILGEIVAALLERREKGETGVVSVGHMRMSRLCSPCPSVPFFAGRCAFTHTHTNTHRLGLPLSYSLLFARHLSHSQPLQARLGN